MTMPSVKPSNVGLSENRKASKPLIEKRRRARINNSLAQLKSMVVGSVTSSNSPNGKPPKLEKADILEMTVAHLKKMHHGLMKAPDDDKYMAGFSYCLKEVRQFIECNIDNESKSQVLDYLNCFADKIMTSGIQQSQSTDLETGMDDSSCSSNSRSETPSSTFIESSPMDYRPCSPSPDRQPDSSSASSFNRTINSENRLEPESSKWTYANPDSSRNRLLTPGVCANQSYLREHNEPVHRFGPLNLSYSNSSPSNSEEDCHEQRKSNPHSSNALQSNFVNNSNLDKRQEQRVFQEQLLMVNLNQVDTNGCVWRPW